MLLEDVRGRGREAALAARGPFQRQDGEHHEQQQRGELGRGGRAAQGIPGAIDAGGEGAQLEVGDRAEIGQRLHHDEGEAGGDGRTRQRQADAAEGAHRRAAQGPADLQRAQRLLGEPGAGEHVDIGIEGGGQDEDRTAQRADVRGTSSRANPSRSARADASGAGRTPGGSRCRRRPARRRASPAAAPAPSSAGAGPGKRYMVTSQPAPAPSARVPTPTPRQSSALLRRYSGRTVLARCAHRPWVGWPMKPSSASSGAATIRQSKAASQVPRPGAAMPRGLVAASEGMVGWAMDIPGQSRSARRRDSAVGSLVPLPGAPSQTLLADRR